MAERRTERGVFRQLLEELRLEDEESYRRYLRLNTETFQVRLMVFHKVSRINLEEQFISFCPS